MARLSKALAMLLSVAVVADQAITAPEAQLPQYFADYGMVVSLDPSDAMPVASQYPVVPLTKGVGLNTTLAAVNAISVRGSLVSVDQSNYNEFNDTSRIAYVSCDPNTEQSNISPSDVLNGLMDSPTHPKAILLYTTNSSLAYCSLVGNDLTYQSIWSMVSSEDAWAARNLTAVASASTVEATISGNTTTSGSASATDANGGSNSAVAMSILYSITGLITLLFLVIIATGAVRAHRHPERYGPRAGYGGRPRQSRARGLARAVLETLPIVKFGDPHPVKGDSDQELESVPGERQVDSPEPVQAKSSTNPAGQAVPAEGTIAADKNGAAVGSGATPPTQGENTNNEHLGCTICTEDFTVGEDVRVLPCDHKFHPACIDPWLVNVSGTCPLCRLDLRPQGAASEGRNSAEQPTTNGLNEGETAPENSEAETRQDRRRSRLLDWNRLRHASVDERIQALRQIREQGRSDEAVVAQQGTHHARLTDRLRDKFHIRTRTQS
ncbi:hypothetical protein AB5N19_00721 [Seiridium cardinale]